MAQTFTITCINKTDRTSRHERISHVGGQYLGGGRWRKTQEQAIQEIDSGASRFFVRVPPKTIEVIIVRNAPRPYLRTKPDDDPQDNLLNLAECPEREGEMAKKPVPLKPPPGYTPPDEK